MTVARTKQKRGPMDGLTRLAMLFYFLAFLMLFFKSWDFVALALCAAVPAVILAGSSFLPRRLGLDRSLMLLLHFLCALSVLLLYRFDPERGLRQCLHYAIGMGTLTVCALAVRRFERRPVYAALLAALGLLFLAAPLVLGREVNGARNWVFIGSVSFQPSEAVKLCLLLVLAYLLSTRHRILAGVYAVLCLLLLMLQKDLGTAFLYYAVTLAMLYLSTGSMLLVGAGAAGAAAAGVFGYTQFAHVRRRVAIWIDPWADPSGDGYQIVQGLIAMANGGAWGVGLGLGNASVIPYYHNDFIFSVILNEMGAVFGLIVLGMYLCIVVRGLMLARRARSAFDTLLAAGSACLICLQTFVIVGGNIKLIPLTGVTLPFISYGGTSMLSSMSVLGMMAGVASRVDDSLGEDRRIAGMREESR